MQQFDKITGRFEPKRADTLSEKAKPYIGKLMTFEALWLIDEDDGGAYVGQWAMRPIDKNGEYLPMGWVPEEDIKRTVIPRFWRLKCKERADSLY